MTVLFFFGIGLAQFGIGGEILAFFSFLLFIATLIFTVMSLNSFRNVRYYVTNLRLVSERKNSGDLQLQNWTTVRIAQDFLNKIRGIGTIYFDSNYSGRVVFQRVKEPEAVKQTAISARSRLPPLPQQIRPSQPPLQQMRPSQQPIIREVIKETIKETVLVQCRHCGARAAQGTLRCPACGANL